MNQKICGSCGEIIPIVVQLLVIQSWMWRGLVSVLLDETLVIPCPRCSNKLTLPTITALLLPNSKKLLSRELGEDINPLINNQNSNLYENIIDIETTNSVEDLQVAICEHVLSYKPLLKDLFKAQQEGRMERFITERWRELTPTALAACSVAITGLVKGVGISILDQSCKEKLGLKESWDILENLLANIQVQVWMALVVSNFDESYTFEHALLEHILDKGIFDKSTEMFGELLSKLMEDNKLPGRVCYTSLALYASIIHIRKLNNVFETYWCKVYFDFESEMLQIASENSSMKFYKISDKRAASTISEKTAWNVIASQFNRDTSKNSQELLKSIADKLGYKHLAERVMTSLRVTGDMDSLFNLTCDLLDRSCLDTPTESPVSFLRFMKLSLIEFGDMQLIDRVYSYAKSKTDHNYEHLADLDGWYGECAKLLRSPARYLEQIGEEPREWEHHLPLKRRVDLWNERANSFRLLRKSQRALDIIECLLKEIKNEKEYDFERFILTKNRGILLREVGAADESLRQLSDLLDGCALEERAGLLESYATTCHVLGRYDDAINALQQAVPLAKIGGQLYVDKIKGLLAQDYAIADRYEEAFATLNEIETPSLPSEISLIKTAVYLNLLFKNVPLNAGQHQQLQQLIQQTSSLLSSSSEKKDFLLMEQLLSMMAHLTYFSDPKNSESMWQELLSLREAQNYPPDPVALVRMASIAYQNHERVDVVRLLSSIPRALVQSFGEIKDVSIAFDTTRAVRYALNDLMKVAMDSKAPWSDIRLIAELKRDTIGKARFIQRRKMQLMDVTLLETGIFDEVIAKIAPKYGCIAVLEWTSTGSGIFALLTTVECNGKVSTKPIDACKFDLFTVRAQIMHRLSVWHAGRKGDPFDIPIWQELESWLHGEIEKWLPEGQHVIIIEDEALVGLPWHVAISPRWRSSYSPGWAMILDDQPITLRQPLQLGVFSAPRYLDSDIVREAMSSSVNWSRQWAESNGCSCLVYDNESADQEGYKKLMANCDAVKLLCHGYVNPHDNEIALLVSFGGTLPPIHSPNRADRSDANRLSWRDLQALQRTPPIVLSCACSTGLQWRAGAGEQMGLLGALWHGGTRAFIAPRWDVIAVDVLPLLDEILAKHLTENTSLIDALHQTCLEAEHKLPRWLAWSISLEGSWK